MSPEETLDRRDADPALVRATLADLTVANALFGGRQAALHGVRRVLRGAPDRPVTLLDVGAGTGDVARYVARRLAPRRVVRPIALDHLRDAARLTRAAGTPAMVADLARLPLRPASVDVVLLSQVLHHLDRSAGITVLRSLARVARIGLVVADLRRSPLARLGIWAAAYALRFHRVTREDGMLSVDRGYSREGLGALMAQAGLGAPVVRRPGWRLVAWWRTDAHG